MFTVMTLQLDAIRKTYKG